MEGVFTEFENENALRTYPFAGGCVPGPDADIPEGLFVDAVIYPVNAEGPVFLSSVSETGVVSVSDSTGVIMTGTASGAYVEFRDVSGLARHVGTLIASSSGALGEFVGRGVAREYPASATTFAAGCVFPVMVDGVTSVSVGGGAAEAGVVGFSNGPDDDVRVSSGESGDGRQTLRFDVIPKMSPHSEGSIRRIICVVDGRTPFRIERHQASYNTIVLTLDGIDKDMVCAFAHRENDYEMADTCKCGRPSSGHVDIPEVYQRVEVFIPPTEDRPEGAENAFYLVVPNLINYGNPLSITLEDGVTTPKTSSPEVVVDGYAADLADGALLDEVSDKSIVLQVPGLSGGLI